MLEPWTQVTHTNGDVNLEEYHFHFVDSNNQDYNYTNSQVDAIIAEYKGTQEWNTALESFSSDNSQRESPYPDTDLYHGAYFQDHYNLNPPPVG